MGLFSWLFGKKESASKVRKRKDEPDVVNVESSDDKMNWAIEKANLTLHYFEACLQNPKPGQSYLSIKVRIVDGQKVEHLWLKEPSFDAEGNLFGVVGNEPIDVTTVKFGQKIGIDRELISDWMIVENGRLIGGYTIRAIRSNYTGKDLENFDRSLGGIHVDYGEDYFLPSDKTPEGAIVQLEEAYNEDNIEKALSCKDFTKEAELMLAKLKKENVGEEIVQKTAEVLKMAFISSLQENGMPKFNGIKRAFPKREKVSDQHMIVTEVCYYPDGNSSIQRMNTYKIGDHWKVMAPED
ncbi:MAG: DUF2314 domain-containing protein [Saprospiraceae bacterium]|nr:DUF2314 domain-containing protein [Saprospiraceae bacterium]